MVRTDVEPSRKRAGVLLKLGAVVGIAVGGFAVGGGFSQSRRLGAIPLPSFVTRTALSTSVCGDTSPLPTAESGGLPRINYEVGDGLVQVEYSDEAETRPIAIIAENVLVTRIDMTESGAIIYVAGETGSNANPEVVELAISVDSETEIEVWENVFNVDEYPLTEPRTYAHAGYGVDALLQHVRVGGRLVSVRIPLALGNDSTATQSVVTANLRGLATYRNDLANGCHDPAFVIPDSVVVYPDLA